MESKMSTKFKNYIYDASVESNIKVKHITNYK